jgi:hypothetical protein
VAGEPDQGAVFGQGAEFGDVQDLLSALGGAAVDPARADGAGAVGDLVLVDHPRPFLDSVLVRRPVVPEGARRGR